MKEMTINGDFDLIGCCLSFYNGNKLPNLGLGSLGRLLAALGIM